MPTRARARLPELDLMRVFAAAAVVALHALGYYLAVLPAGDPDRFRVQAGIIGLRFARQVFMFVTGFALMYTLCGRPLRAAAFFARRGRKVLLPYLVWSLMYLAVSHRFGLPVAPLPAALLRGDAFYHLYYVIVTLQFYLLVPVLKPVLERLPLRAAGTGLLAVVLAYPLLMAHWPAWLDPRDRLLPAYLPYFAAGAVAGAHPRAWSALTRRWAGAAALLMAAVWGRLVWELRSGAPWAQVIDLFRPAMLVYGLAGAVVLWAAAARWGGTWLRTLAPYTYGVYLAHPLVLFLTEHYALDGVQPRGWHALLLTAFGAAASWLLVAALARTPLSGLLAGVRSPVRGAAARSAAA